MVAQASDLNLLFGMLALQLDFITKDQLIAAMQAWILDKSKPLGQILRGQGTLAADGHQLLEALVQKHLHLHGGDAQKSLASLSSAGSAPQALIGLKDADLEASLALAAPQREPANPDPFATAAVAKPSSGDTRFRILRPHAKGGLGVVFVAHDEEIGREVALKEIQLSHAHDHDSKARFVLEAEITGGLEHPGIVPVYGLGHYGDGRPFYAMRFIRGDSFKEAVDRFHAADGPQRDATERDLALRQLLRRFFDVCNAIEYAHSKGVLHRDLKPGNIMLGKFGETLVVDWGLAKATGKADPKPAKTLPEGPLLPTSGSASAPTQMGSAVGTPAYMSPEQAAGRLDLLGPASDVYSLGATLYYALTGHPPITSTDLGDVLSRVQNGDFPRPRQVNPRIHPALDAICLKAMALDPSNRYASAGELKSDVELWLDDSPVSAWSEPLSVKARRWLNRHRTIASATAAALLAAVVFLGILFAVTSNANEKLAKLAEDETTAKIAAQKALAGEELQKQKRALAQINALCDAAASAVPAILRDLEENQASILPQLRERYAAEPPGARRMRLALAILPSDPSTARGELIDWLLRVEDPAEVLLAREALTPHKEGLLGKLWAVVEAPEMGMEFSRLNAAAALAKYDAQNEKWKNTNALVVNDLVQQNTLFMGQWNKAFASVKNWLIPPLSVVFRDRNQRDFERSLATDILAVYAADQPQVLADLLMDADQKQFRILYPKAKEHGERFISGLVAEIDKKAGAARDTKDFDAKEVLAKRQANAAVALLKMNRPEKIWPLLEHSPDPRVRSYLIHRFAPLGADASAILHRLDDEPVPSIRRALILSLGEYDPNGLAADQRRRATAQLQDIYRTADDPGLHAAAEWLLRTWKHDAWLKQVNDDWAKNKEERDHRLKEIQKLIAKDSKTAQPRWWVNGEGQTMVIIPGPVEFLMGSPTTEVGRSDYETLHKKRIGRKFAVAAKAVTMEQFAKFEKGYRIDAKFHRMANLPVVGTEWYRAAAYCNWLSEREGIPEDQWCYEADKSGKLTKLKASYLSLTGYRLPTEAEMEYVTRAGASTSRYFGETDELLPKYAWYTKNSTDFITWPIGSLKPNDLGFSDVHGNAYTWCQSSYKVYANIGLDNASEDREDDLEILPAQSRVLRGGCFSSQSSIVRSANRDGMVPSTRSGNNGFRLARTLTP